MVVVGVGLGVVVDVLVGGRVLVAVEGGGIKKMIKSLSSAGYFTSIIIKHFQLLCKV